MKVKISILCPSFNHEKYIPLFMQSVLGQSFNDFELIIVDDCSTDNNVARIQEFKDSRIKLVKHSYNMGLNASINTTFEHSSGDILILCASDDILEKDALQKIYTSFISNPNILAVYPNLSVINEDNLILDLEYQPLFLTRSELLHHIFFEGNCLNSPGLSMRRKAFELIYPLQISSCNLQDVLMHVNFLINGEILLLKDKLIKYRRSDKNVSLSANTHQTKLREELEIDSLLDTYLKINDLALLKEVFKDEIQKTNVEPFADTIEFFLGVMGLQARSKTRKIWAYHKIMNAYSTQTQAQILYDKYKFSFKDFLNLTKKFKEKDDKITMKYKKYKRLFNISSFLLLVSFVFLLFVGLR